MSSSTALTVVINALDNASKVLRQLASNAEGSFNQMTRAGDKVSKNFDAMAKAGQIASGIIIRDMARSLTNTASEALTLGAKLGSLQSSFDSLVKTTGGTTLSLEKLRKATRNTVADVDLLKAANQAMALGLPTDQIDALFAAAMKLGRAMGIDTLTAVNSLATGIGRQSKLILDNLGIVFQARDAYEWYAQKLGVSSSALDENQKKLAWQSYAIEQVTKRAEALGPIQDDAVTGQEQWAAASKNLATSLGSLLAPLGAFKGIIEMMLPVIMTTAATVIPQWISAHGGLKKSLEAIGTSITALPGKISGLGKSISNLNITTGQLALSIGAGIAAFAGVYSILMSLDPSVRTAAAALAILIGVMVTVTAVAIAMWTAVSATTMLPVILAGIGAAVAGVTVILASCGAEANNFKKSMDNVTTGATGMAAGLGGMYKALEDLELKHQEAAKAIEESYETQVKAAEDWKEESIETLNAYFTDKYGTTQTELSKLEDMINAHYDELVRAEEQAYQDALEAVRTYFTDKWGTTETELTKIEDFVNDHYDNLVQEAEDAYEAELQAVRDYYIDLWGETETELSKIEDFINDHYDNELRDMEGAYADQLAETNAFYDELLGIAETGLSNIRDAREQHLDQLELTYLRQKAELEARHQEEQMGEEEHQAALNTLEENYREERARVRDHYRLQELEAEQQFRVESEGIEQERTDAIEAIEEQHVENTERLEQERRDVIEDAQEQVQQATDTHIAELDRLEDERQADVEEAKAMIQQVEDEHNAQMVILENQRKADLAEANARMEQIQAEFKAEIERLEAELRDNMLALATETQAGREAIYEQYNANILSAQRATNEAYLTNLQSTIETARSQSEQYSPYVGGIPRTGGPIPVYQGGGVAGLYGPELALVGEREPELITPLSMLRRLMTAYAVTRVIHNHFNITADLSSPMKIRETAQLLAKYVAEEERRQGLS